MSRFCGYILLVMVLGTPAWADLIHDNYLGRPNDPGWNLPYDRVLGLSSERDTFVDASWTADDLVVPPFQYYVVQQIKWIALVEEHPTPPVPDYSHVEVAIYRANPAYPGPGEDPILQGEPPVATWMPTTRLDVDSLVPLGDSLGDMAFYEGTVTLPEDVVLEEGHYYYAVRVWGNNLGRHMIASTGGDGVDPNNNIIAGETMAAFRSLNFFNDHWVDVDQRLEIPDPNNPGQDIAYATDFAYQIYGIVTPEPATVILLLLAGVALRVRR